MQNFAKLFFSFFLFISTHFLLTEFHVLTHHLLHIVASYENKIYASGGLVKYAVGGDMASMLST